MTVWQPRQLPAGPGSSAGAGAVRNCVALAADKQEGRVWTGHSDGTVSARNAPSAFFPSAQLLHPPRPLAPAGPAPGS